MQVTNNLMSESKAVDLARVALGLCLLVPGLPALAQGQVQPSGNQPRPTATGPSTPAQSSAVAGAQQNLYEASGQNGAQASQDSFKGSIVEGKSTGTVLDLSLDDAIQRGLRQNLGFILQNFGAAERERPAAGAVAGSAADGDRGGQHQCAAGEPCGLWIDVSGVQPDRRTVSGGRFSRAI